MEELGGILAVVARRRLLPANPPAAILRLYMAGRRNAIRLPMSGLLPG